MLLVEFTLKILETSKDCDCVYIDDAESLQQALLPRLSPDPRLSIRRRPD
jgi:hypothetical protein